MICKVQLQMGIWEIPQPTHRSIRSRELSAKARNLTKASARPANEFVGSKQLDTPLLIWVNYNVSPT